MNDLKFAFRQLLKNPGFTVHPPQCRRQDRVQFPERSSGKSRHRRHYCYGGRAVAVLTLALGIGANTAIFSVVNAILVRPLPYQEPGRLVRVFENHLTNGWLKMNIGAPVLEEWRRQNTVFEGLGAVRGY